MDFSIFRQGAFKTLKEFAPIVCEPPSLSTALWDSLKDNNKQKSQVQAIRKGLVATVHLYNALINVLRAKTKPEKIQTIKGAIIIAAMEIMRLNIEMVNIPREATKLPKRKIQQTDMADTEEDRRELKKRKKEEAYEAIMKQATSRGGGYKPRGGSYKGRKQWRGRDSRSDKKEGGQDNGKWNKPPRKK